MPAEVKFRLVAMDGKAQDNQVELGRLTVSDEASALREVDRLKRVLALAGAETFETTLTARAVSELLKRSASSDHPACLYIDLVRDNSRLNIRIDLAHRSQVDFDGPYIDYFSVVSTGDDNLLLTRSIEIPPPGAGFEREAAAVIEQKTEAEIKTMILEKESADAAKMAQLQFMRKMSHELRTPLNVILGYTEILREEPKDDQADDDLRAIHEAGKQLLAIIDNVLDFSRLEMGDYDVGVESFSCRELLDEIIGELEHLWNRHDNRFELSVPDDDIILETDRKKLRCILDNLLINAAEFTEHGLIRMTCSKVKMEDRREGVEFEVADTGIGMNTAGLNNLFHPFIQKDESTTRGHGGIGMGLALCQRYSQILGGTLEVTSRPAEGTRFTLRVPAKLAD